MILLLVWNKPFAADRCYGRLTHSNLSVVHYSPHVTTPSAASFSAIFPPTPGIFFNASQVIHEILGPGRWQRELPVGLVPIAGGLGNQLVGRDPGRRRKPGFLLDQ